jgi:plasmid replication initiation protein
MEMIIMKNIESKDLVVKSNELVEARYRLTATEQKIIYKLISVINKYDEDFKPYIFKISELMELMDTTNKNLYTEVKDTTKNLMKKVFTIKDKIKKSELQVAWFSSAEYKDGEGLVELEFSPKLKPFLLQLKEAFTQFDIKNVMQLRSGYSCRIYELLKQKEYMGERVLAIADLRKKLGIEDIEYKLYGDFKRKIILQSQKEINAKTDISFEFEEIKGIRKKVTAIKFIIHSKNPTQIELSESNIVQTEQVVEPVKEILLTFEEQKNRDLIRQTKEVIEIFKNIYNEELEYIYVNRMIRGKGIEIIKKYLDEFPIFVTEVKKQDKKIDSLSRLFTYFVNNIKTKKKVINNAANIPQHTNFEQRTYTEKDFKNFFNKAGEE